MAKKMRGGDITNAVLQLKKLKDAILAKDVAGASTALFSFLDELRKAFQGTPLVVMHATAGSEGMTCPADGDCCDWDAAAACCDELMGNLKKVEGGEDGVSSFNWAALLPLILQLASLFVK